MPELPEVETLRRQLAPRLKGRRIHALRVLDPRWCEPTSPRELESAVRGCPIVGFDRRGKYLVLELSPADANSPLLFLVMHLRMTGNLLYGGPMAGKAAGTLPTKIAPDSGSSVAGRPTSRHLRARFELDDGARLMFIDPRRFGHATPIDDRAELEAYFGERLGVEPLSAQFGPASLQRLVEGRSTAIKAFLLDQRKIAGIGNIYADEVLFRARIHPLQPAGTLKRAEVERLHEAVAAALEAGLEAEGASIDNFRHFDGQRGRMQDELLVHRRSGSTCPRCGRPVVKIRVAGRGTYICPGCQRLRRRKLKKTQIRSAIEGG